MTHCGSRLKIVKNVKAGENTLQHEVILMEKEDLKVSAQELQLIGIVITVTNCELDFLSKNVDS
jgi:hypothetical protein